MVATTGELPVLTAAKDAMFPDPVAPNPIPGVSLVQAYVVVPPVRLEVNTTGPVFSVSQTTWSAGSSTCAVGLTVIVNSCVGHVQVTPPLVKLGVTVIVATTGDVPPLTATKVGISPVPVAASPIPGVSLTQS